MRIYTMFLRNYCFRSVLNYSSRFKSNLIDVSPEVQSALHEKKAVVALESTILTHGMPHPKNYQTSNNVEKIIRDQGCVPAHIAVVEGRVKVGLSDEELQRLSDPKNKPIKVSRRDFPFVISKRMYGGTTVCGTLLIANSVGIKIFVTGGIGGVHRFGEDTLDISADLRELGRHPIMVISSGVKSILDIELTLEYLETEGVCVISYGPSKNFPAFYSASSSFVAPYHVRTPTEAARLLQICNELHMNSGLLLAVPVPVEFSLDSEMMNTTIELALKEAEKTKVKGKEITPYLLNKLGLLTEGKSLETNIALIKNNALIGAQVAKEYEKLSRWLQNNTSPLYSSSHKSVVIGGSVLDCVISLEADLLMDGRTLTGKIEQTPGGVGRNMADALGKLYRTPPLFLSAVGSDQYGSFILESLKHVDSSGVVVRNDERTACYSAVIDKFGEAKLGVGDMRIHSIISAEQVSKHQSLFFNSPIVLLDGNVPQETIDYVLKVASQNKTPIWFEPTDLSKSIKPFHTNFWKSLTCISPNINELLAMAKSIGLPVKDNLDYTDTNDLLRQLSYLAVALAEHIPLIMVTMGKKGLMMVSKFKADETIIDNIRNSNTEIFVRYYPVEPLANIVNAVGAGDSAAAGFVSGILQGFTESECVNLAFRASREALNSTMAIPKKFETPSSLRETAEFVTIPVL